MVRHSAFNKLNYAAFITVVSNSLQMAGVVKGEMNSDQRTTQQNRIIQQVLSWFERTHSFIYSIVLMFVICFLKDFGMSKCKLSDFDVIMNHVRDEANSSCDMTRTYLCIGDMQRHYLIEHLNEYVR